MNSSNPIPGWYGFWFLMALSNSYVTATQEFHTSKRLETMREGMIPRNMIGNKAFS